MAFEEFDSGTNRLPSLGAVQQQQSQFVPPNIFEPDFSVKGPLDFNAPQQQPAFDPNSFTNQSKNAPPVAPSFTPAPQPEVQAPFEVVSPALTPGEISALPPANIAPSAVPPQQTAPSAGGFQVQGATPTGEQARDAAIRQAIEAGTTQLPLGGQGSLEGLPPTMQGEQRAMEPDEIARQEEIRKGIEAGGTEAQRAQRMVREAKQQTTIRESGAKRAGQKIARSLREAGMTEDDIRGDEGFKKAKTEQERFQALNRIQKREQLKRIDAKKNQRLASRLESKQKRAADGSPLNDQAVAVDYNNFFSEINPETNEPMKGLMTKSQAKEWERYRQKASIGGVSDSDTGRIEAIKSNVMKKAEAAKQRKVVDERNRLINQKIKDAKTKEEKDFYSTRQSQLKGIEERLEGKFSRTEKKSGGLKDQLEIQQRTLNEEIAAGYRLPEPPLTITDEERKEAEDWLAKNPNDPNAPAVRAKLGIK